MNPPQTPAERIRRLTDRRLEVVLAAACSVATVLSLVVVTGFVPGVFAPSPISFEQRLYGCPPIAGGFNSTSEVLPVGTIHVHWTATVPGTQFLEYFLNSQTGSPVLQWLGTNGSGSFFSAGGRYFFWPAAVIFGQNSSCATVTVTTVVSYSTW